MRSGPTARSWRPVGVREGQSSSDKELKAMADDPVEDGLRPWGGSAMLFENHGCHSLVQRLKVVALSLAIGRHLVCSSLRSSLTTLSSGATVWILTSGHSSDHGGSIMRTSALWMGRTLPGAGCPSGVIWSQDKHGLLCGGGEAGLPGKLRQQIPNAIMSSGV